jgi:hypothetical protein
MRYLWLAFVLGACGSSSGGDGDAIFRIEVEPAFASVTVALGGTAENLTSK